MVRDQEVRRRYVFEHTRRLPRFFGGNSLGDLGSELHRRIMPLRQPSDATDLPEGSVELVLSNSVLEHITGLEKTASDHRPPLVSPLLDLRHLVLGLPPVVSSCTLRLCHVFP